MKVEKMKGIVVEKNSDNCVLLLSDGTFKTVKATETLQIGTVLYMNSTVRSVASHLKRAVPMIAAVFVVALLGLGAYSWSIPVQYINVDINPSVELVINRYERIIKTTPLNDDGQKLLESVNLQLGKYEKGVNAVIEAAKNMGYLKDEGDVLISISSSDNDLRQKTKGELEEIITQPAEVLVFDSTEHDRSIREGLSPGKSKIINKVIESGTNLSEEELAAAPVKDLMLRIKENRKMNMELEKEAKQQEKQQKEMERANRKDTEEGSKDNQEKEKIKPEPTGKEDKPKENGKTDNGKQDDKNSIDNPRGNIEKEKQESNKGKNGNNGNNENNTEDEREKGSSSGKKENDQGNPDKPVNAPEKGQGDSSNTAGQQNDTTGQNQSAEEKNNNSSKGITDNESEKDDKQNPSGKSLENANKQGNDFDVGTSKEDAEKSVKDSNGNGNSGKNSTGDGKNGGRG